MHDLVIRGGTVVDGTGAPPAVADVAIDGSRIVAVGRVHESGRETIDARGFLVTPGFVDVHTHYDGQATWDPQLAPSCWHGVTTVVLGNCGVGFAPARRDRHDWLIGLMEGVEDIPGAALAAGMPLGLGDLSRVPGRARAPAARARRRRPGPARRAACLRDGRARRRERARDTATTSRRWRASCARRSTPARSASRPRARSGTAASTDVRCRAPSRARTSCSASAGRSRARGHGVFEVAQAGVGGRTAGDPRRCGRAEVAWMARLSATIGRPVSFLVHADERRARARGGGSSRSPTRRGAAARTSCRRSRPVRSECWSGTSRAPTRSPSVRPTGRWRRCRSPERVVAPARSRGARVRSSPSARRRLAEPGTLAALFGPAMYARLFPLGDPPDYEPAAERERRGDRRRARDGDPEAVLYDLMLRPRRRASCSSSRCSTTPAAAPSRSAR